MRKILHKALNILYLVWFLTQTLNSTETIDILGDFPVNEHFNIDFKKIIDSGFELRFITVELERYREEFYHSGVKKIFFMGEFAKKEQLSLFPREKLVLFVWEPYSCGPGQYWSLFSRVYTHNDNWVNNRHSFRFNYPSATPVEDSLLRFEERGLCTTMSRNWTKERLKILKFFDRKPKGEFIFYGVCPSGFEGNSMYGGVVDGIHSGIEKKLTINRYRFYICFENEFMPGYMSEKIFNCFSAGCVPVYLGAPNVTQYIPKNCFIDYRDFASNEALYRYLKNMEENKYNEYLQNIRAFLDSPAGYVFTSEYFVDLIYNECCS